MRNSTGGTSSAKKSHNNTASNNDEKNSAKKLVQARLPFKVIAPGSSPTIAADSAATPKKREALKEGKTPKQGTQKETKDARKRKLSYESEDEAQEVEEVDNVSKENVEVKSGATVKKKKITSTATNNDDDIECISLLDDEQDETKDTARTDASSSKAASALKTPKAGTKGKTKGAGTPQPTATPGSEHKGKGGSNHNSKLQIKLPLSAGKRNKRRKSKANNSLANTSALDTSLQNNSCADSCDDIEEISGELNPQKRTKLDYEEEEAPQQAKGSTEESKESVRLETESSSDECKKSEKANESRKTSTKSESSKDTKKSETKTSKSIKEISVIKKDGITEKSIVIDSDDDDDKKSDAEATEDDDKNGDDDEEEENDDDDDNDEDADDERENNATNRNSSNVSTEEESKTSKHNTTIESIKADNELLKNKNLTPKQKKLLEQRQKAREEKERKIQEEKRKKQQEKEEKELAKKREREEKEEQKRKEREEKEEQKRKEREEKERKRLAEIEAKNEEKRKRNEAKEEELRKKDEERKRKEQEKEEAEMKKKKAAEAFTKFFVAKAPSSNQQNLDDDENTGDGTKSLAFRPFQIKGDMKLAPICRKILSEDAKNRIDHLLGLREDDEDIVRTKPLPKSKLYLSELRSGQILPGKWRRPSTDSKDDVVIVEDELERVGEAIVEDTPAYIREEMRVKFYKFHDNRRPPYYGTWRKKSKVITGRRPFAQDTKFCDYEVDSDDEWEEEEPGESLEDASDDDKEKESEDDDYEVDNEWFVPHGHLSEEEMQNEDELGDDCNDREAQKAKLKIIQQEFAQEMKKKTEKIKPRLIGCIWINRDGKQPESCPSIIWEKLNTKAMLCTDPPLLEEPELEEPLSPTASNTGNEKSSAVEKIKPVTITDAMIKDLVKLLHGNNNSKAFLIKEFIAYIAKTEESVINGEFAHPLKSVIREKIDSVAEWQIVDAQPQTNEDLNESLKKKKKTKKRLCWVVSQETLDKLNMSSLSLQNDWEYTLKPRLKVDKGESAKSEERSETVETNDENKCNSAPINNTVDSKDSKSKCINSPITKFTKVLTKADEKASKVDSNSTSSTTRNKADSSPKDVTTSKKSSETKAKTSPPNTSNKEKKRLSLPSSVGRGQQSSTPAKNKLISQFLQKGSNSNKTSSPTTNKRNPNKSVVINGDDDHDDDDDDVIILD
ncbi:chromatin assembly factor 1 subunit A [Musca vetustissima]|uniref:chromatin assembly factor 1 subunit A n=1 Tax=Musca vetustissima TaxID=27455 RepID=UPI002AB70B66|nr:chromatin assembly factor 1 subunit A [Musca vetustissima]